MRHRICVIIVIGPKALQLCTHESLSGWLSVALVLLVLWSSHLASCHTISPFEVARLVDRRLAREEQVAAAVESTTGNRLERALSRTQVRLATSRLRDVDPVAAVPLVVPWRDLRSLALVAVLYLGVGYAGTLGITIPR